MPAGTTHAAVTRTKSATLVTGNYDTVTINPARYEGQIGHTIVRVHNEDTSVGLRYTFLVSTAGTAPTAPATDGSVDGGYYLPPGATDEIELDLAVGQKFVARLISLAGVTFDVEAI